MDIKVNNLTKEYIIGDRVLTVLKNADFQIQSGTTCAIIGPSGSGKSTLLGLCAGLDQPTCGDVELIGNNLSQFSEDELAKFRNKNVGFVFQTFQLIPTLTAIENVMVPAELLNDNRSVEVDAEQLLNDVGLKERLHHYPLQLSGGEQQRVGLARAFINKPKILFADEPTGNLDNETGVQIEDLLFELNRTYETTLVLVTHNHELAARTDRIIKLKGGEIIESDLP